MALPFFILAVLIAIAPVLAVFSISGAAALAAATAAMTTLASVAARQADANHLASALRGTRFLLALPLLVIAAQLLPVSLFLAHPVWTIVVEATGGLRYGHITIDLGRTLAVFIVALALVAAMTCSTIVARDRRRAELLLIGSGAVSAIISLWTIAQLLAPSLALTAPRSAMAIPLASLGIVLNAAAMLLAFERRETRRQEAKRYLPIALGSGLALLLDIGCLAIAANASQAIAAGIGVAMLLLLMAIRRLNLSSSVVVGLCAAALIGIGILAAWLFGVNPAASGLLRFVRPPDADTFALLQRVLSDGRWLGSGAGTMDVLARIYQTMETMTPLAAPTAVIQLAVEAGWIGLCVFAVVTLGFCVKLFRCALERGRDWFFPAAAAAGIVGSLFGSIVGPGLFELPVALMLVVIIGIGLSQAFSQSGR